MSSEQFKQHLLREACSRIGFEALADKLTITGPQLDAWIASRESVPEEKVPALQATLATGRPSRP